MSEFEINLLKVKGILSGNDGIVGELGNLGDEIDNVSGNLGIKTSESEKLQKRLKNVSKDVRLTKVKVQYYGQCLQDISNMYEKTERGICDAAADGKITLKENIQRMAGDVIEYGGGIFRNIAIGPATAIADLIINTEVGILTGEGKVEIKSDANLYDSDDDPNLELKKEKQYRKTLTEWETDPATGEKRRVTREVKEGSDDEKKFNEMNLGKAATLMSVTGSVSGSLVDINTEKELKYGSVSNELTVRQAEAHASAYAGLYSIDADGNKHFTPGVGAEVGASITAFSDEAKAVLGNDDWNAFAEGTVTVGRAEAQASADVGFVDKEGNFNPTLNVSASVEAIAAAATVAVGATVAGTKIAGNAGVSVGVGAHANVGMKDGVISLDVGAAIGVGVSVNLEIDMSGTFKKIGDGAKSLVSKAKSLIWH